MARILNRYLLKQVFVSFIGVTAILMVVLIAARFMRFLGQAADGNLDPASVFTLLGLTTLHYMVLLFPPAILISVQLALGRLYRDSEMHAVMACGIGVGQLYRPLLGFAFALTAIVAALTLYVTPWAGQFAEEVRGRAKHEAQVGFVEAGRFQSFDRGRAVLFAEQVDEENGELRELFLYSRADVDSAADSTVRASQGRFAVDKETGDRSLVLENGWRYQGVPGQASWEVTQFEEHGVYFNISPPDIVISERSLRPTSSLMGSDKPEDRAELQWRLAYPLAVFMLVLLAVPMSKVEPRQGRYGRLIGGLLAYILYFNVMGILKVQIEKAALPEWPGIWVAHGLVLLWVLFLLWREGVFVKIPNVNQRMAGGLDE
ncbi:MAG: LPS export ABC transporter permease LptF [Gammaproteobacteria bacterium]|nr:LPS export ABC transporter permease LptF [Gammaproteobacteria bacterium]